MNHKYTEIKLLTKHYRLNTIQYSFNYIFKYIFGKRFCDMTGLSHYIIYDKSNDKKFYASNLSYVYEQLNDEYANTKFKPGKDKLIIDIGAACGEFAYEMIKKGCILLCVEPDVTNFNYLSKNLIMYDDIILLNQRIDYINSLNNLLITYNSIDLLKIDVDGEEYKVLRSGWSILHKTKHIIIEIDDMKSLKKIKKLLTKYNFKFKTYKKQSTWILHADNKKLN